jgi:Ca-activated chloride channel family protein
MVDDNELMRLGRRPVPTPSPEARARALGAAMSAFEAETKNAVAPKGEAVRPSLTNRARKLWSEIMNQKLSTAAPAWAGLIALPVAGYAAYALVQQSPMPFGDTAETVMTEPVSPPLSNADGRTGPAQPVVQQEVTLADPAKKSETLLDSAAPAPAIADAQVTESDYQAAPSTALGRGLVAPAGSMPKVKTGMDRTAMPPADPIVMEEENRERFDEYKTNPVRSALESPVSTFSIDVDTASYAFVRKMLKEGILPQPDTVRVEEMVNYFPYDWQGPASAETPFNSNVTVMPTPWNANTKLMHIAIQGYDVAPAETPPANLVFLIDVSGSMDEPDKLPLLRNAFRMLVNNLKPTDTVSIVTYAGNAGTVLEPTKVSDKDKILGAIDRLSPDGSTAGEAGIKAAYRLAEQSFVEGGVNRVMLATDGDFNVGQTDDDDLKRLIEEKRDSGVFLSVFGFGRGNLNDKLMQTLAQNGNGTAAYIDTLAEAEKVLVEEARSTLFTIAKDVKIQVEFNPQTVSEYRLIGYETRALAREDFNDDKVDAGEIGSGASVTAIYEITPKGSAAQQIDDLRYGEAATNNPTGVAHGDEYAFVKIRYKSPDGDISKLITTPVTKANEVASFDAASADQRFSVAVAAFGQKLRDTSQTAGFGYEKITAIATAARGADPFGYRAEFLSLVRLASALDPSGSARQ